MNNNFSFTTRRRLLAILGLSLIALLGLSSCGNPRSQKAGEKATLTAVKAWSKGDFDKYWKLIPHDQRVTNQERATKIFFESDKQRFKEAKGVKSIKAGETSIIKNSASGPTEISIRYTVTFKDKDKKEELVFTGAKIIDGQWYVHRFNWTGPNRFSFPR
ncbi:MAG: hypothetical protein AAGC74_07115 [Verrucomicrobiota bacterium]